MHAFDVLGDPVRRRILEYLTEGEMTSGKIVEAVGAEFRISQAAVSQHLKVLRDNGFAQSRVNGSQRIYKIQPDRFGEIDDWLARFRNLWSEGLDDLASEVEN